MKKLIVKCLCSIHKGIFRWNKQLFFTNKREIFRSFIVPERSPLIEAWAVSNVVDFQSFVGFINLRNFNIVQLCIFSLWISLFNGGVCREFVVKPLWFFYFSLWPAPPFWKSAALSMRITCRERLHPPGTGKNKCSSRSGKSLIWSSNKILPLLWGKNTFWRLTFFRICFFS